MDFKLELVLIPVTDVDRAKAFYVEKCGYGSPVALVNIWCHTSHL